MMKRRDRRIQLERRRQSVHLLKQDLKRALAETGGDVKKMQKLRYLPTSVDGKWRRMTKSERERYEIVE